jgi:hypothetical protein
MLDSLMALFMPKHSLIVGSTTISSFDRRIKELLLQAQWQFISLRWENLINLFSIEKKQKTMEKAGFSSEEASLVKKSLSSMMLSRMVEQNEKQLILSSKMEESLSVL